MHPTIKHHLGAMLTALAAIGTHLVNGEAASTSEPVTPAPADPPQPTTEKPTRGRPRKTAEPAAPAVTIQFDEQQQAEPEKPATPTGKTYEELQAIIKPLVLASRGPEVKKEISKYGVIDLKSLSALPQHHAEFVNNIEALSL